MTDTTMTVPTPLHLAVVCSNGYEHRAECSFCGWVSDWHPSWVAAGEAGAEHRDSAAGSPDRMDQLMSAMLDLQDDLAAVVVWLAENWSANLPVPRLFGTNHYTGDAPGASVAGARLMAAALDAAMLARAAERLGVPVCTDPGPDSCGQRYQRATRRFGRVEVEVVMGLVRGRVGDEHLVEVVYDEDGQVEAGWDPTAGRARAECSCGWTGDWHDNGALAEGEGDDHQEVVA